MIPSLRQQVRRRARDRCEYCLLPQAESVYPHELDHIRSQKHRGRTLLANLCLACSKCNGHKGPNASGFDPETDEMVPLFNPRADQWNEHFEWDGPKLVGKTPSGRATVDVLRINNYERVELRRILMRLGTYRV